MQLLTRIGHHADANRIAEGVLYPRIEALRSRADTPRAEDWRCIEGIWFPCGYEPFPTACSRAMGESVKSRSLTPILDAIEAALWTTRTRHQRYHGVGSDDLTVELADHQPCEVATSRA